MINLISWQQKGNKRQNKHWYRLLVKFSFLIIPMGIGTGYTYLCIPINHLNPSIPMSTNWLDMIELISGWTFDKYALTANVGSAGGRSTLAACHQLVERYIEILQIAKQLLFFVTHPGLCGWLLPPQNNPSLEGSEGKAGWLGLKISITISSDFCLG